MQTIVRPFDLCLSLSAGFLILLSSNLTFSTGLARPASLASERMTISSRDRRLQYPTKIISTKQVTGRLKSLAWGDYFYAKIETQTGIITFLIYRQEDCLVRKFIGKMTKIRYDEIDLYLPEASGYHRVNLIRQIDSIDVAQWQKSRSRSQLQQCQRNRG